MTIQVWGGGGGGGGKHTQKTHTHTHTHNTHHIINNHFKQDSKTIWSGIFTIPLHHFYQLNISLFEHDTPTYGELSDYTGSAHTEVIGVSSRCINGSNVCDCQHCL